MTNGDHVCFFVLPRSASRFSLNEAEMVSNSARTLNASFVRCGAMVPSNDSELQSMIPQSSILVLCLSSAEALMLGGYADISYASLLESAERVFPSRVCLLFRGPDREGLSSSDFVKSLAARGKRLPPLYSQLFERDRVFACDSETGAFISQLPDIVNGARRSAGPRPQTDVPAMRKVEQVCSPTSKRRTGRQRTCRQW